MGLVYSSRSEFEKGEKAMLAALALDDDGTSRPSPMRASLIERVGQHYQMAGQEQPALEHLTRALEMDVALYGEASFYTAIVRQRLADVHRAAGRYAEAETLLSAAVEGLEKSDAIAGDLGAAVGQYGRLLSQDLGRPAEAEPLLRRALELRRAEPRPTARAVRYATLDLARCLVKLEKPEAAATVLGELRATYPVGESETGAGAKQVLELEKELASRNPSARQ
jgi:tetratricopeptide (TPR) repeat protein